MPRQRLGEKATKKGPCQPARVLIIAFARGKVLGKGSFGQAVLVTHKASGKQCVIKEIDISRMPKAERDAAEQEAKVGVVCHIAG